MGIYDYPELYATLMFPETELLEAALEWLDEHLEGPSESMFDPCCGPATWILPFAARGYRVAGNDLGPGMIAEAQRRLSEIEPDHEPELLVGDMRDLQFTSGPFDFAINFHASVGHLDGEASVLKHLRSVQGHLRPGGIYLLGVVVCDGKTLETEPESLYESDPLPVPSGGMAACHYTSVRRDQKAGEELISVLVLTTGVKGVPQRIEDQYMLRAYTAPTWKRLIQEAGAFELLAAHSMADDRYLKVPLGPKCRDLTLILRRKAD